MRSGDDDHAVDTAVEAATRALARARREDGASALHLAAFRGHVPAARALLAAGAEPDARDFKTHVTPVHTAASGGCPHTLTLLLEAADAACVAAGPGTAGAADADEAGEAESADASPARPAPFGAGAHALARTCAKRDHMPLHAAADAGRVETLRVLLRALGAAPPPSARAERAAPRMQDGTTPLHLAAQRGHAEAVVLLASFAVDVDARTPLDGSTALHKVA